MVENIISPAVETIICLDKEETKALKDDLFLLLATETAAYPAARALLMRLLED